jgi:hypothetical protein
MEGSTYFCFRMKRIFTLITILISISLIGIIVIQYSWLKNVVAIDPGIFTGLKLSPDGLSSSQVIQLASIFDTFIKSVFAHCPFSFAALVKWTPDGVVQASRQRSGVVPIFSTGCQASLSRFYGPHTLPTIHFNGDGPCLRGFPD